MSKTTNKGQPVSVELLIRGERVDLKEHSWAILNIWSEDELIALLQRRMEKSESEVRQVLESYHPTIPIGRFE